MPGAFAAFITTGLAPRINAGGKKLRPNAGFSTRTFSPWTCRGTKKEVRCPKPATLSVTSNTPRSSKGTTTEANRRNNQSLKAGRAPGV